MSHTLKDEEDNEELMVRQDLRATPERLEQMDHLVPEALKVHPDLPDCQDHQALEAQKAFKALKVLPARSPDLWVTTQEEDRSLRKKLRLQISQISTDHRRHLELG